MSSGKMKKRFQYGTEVVGRRCFLAFVVESGQQKVEPKNFAATMKTLNYEYESDETTEMYHHRIENPTMGESSGLI
jgi:hypothetical protein